MITPEAMRELAAYNEWQNANIIAILDKLDDTERHKDRGLFFKSLHRTFDHIAMVDSYFLDVLQDRKTIPFAADRVLHAQWPELRHGRIALDRELNNLANAVTQSWGDDVIESFSAKLQKTRRVKRGFYALQLFNHQTHHRSQLTTGLHMMGIEYGNTDMPFRPGIGF
jgi:uncharacterized damage-inducible protein DinB